MTDFISNQKVFAITQGLRGPACVYVLARRGPLTKVGPVKVGIASDVKRRLNAIQTATTFPIDIYCAFPLPRRELARAIETAFHRQHAAACSHGEWFDITPEFAYENLLAQLFESHDLRSKFPTRTAFADEIARLEEVCWEV